MQPYRPSLPSDVWLSCLTQSTVFTEAEEERADGALSTNWFPGRRSWPSCLQRAIWSHSLTEADGEGAVQEPAGDASSGVTSRNERGSGGLMQGSSSADCQRFSHCLLAILLLSLSLSLCLCFCGYRCVWFCLCLSFSLLFCPNLFFFFHAFSSL